MPVLSERITGIVGASGDDGWSVYYRARELAEAGERVIMLTVGDHDIPTDPAILDAMRRSQQAGNLGYAQVNGSKALRNAVSARVAARGGRPVEPTGILVTPGGQAGLYASLVAVLDAGSECIVLDPYYATYQQTVRAAGGRPVVVHTRAEDGFQPDPDLIAAALTPATRAILVNTPNNPTGAVYEETRLRAIADLCRRHDLWLVSDEVYEVQVHEGRHLSPRDLPDMAERTLVVNSLSKSHAMTGSRIGWVLGPRTAIARMSELATTTTYGVPGYIQDAATFALTEGDAIEEAIARRYARRRDAVLRALGNGAAVRVNAPAGGMYVMLDIRATGLSGLDFAHRLLEAEKIAVMPGESFGEAAAGHLRIALTRPEAELAEALGRLAAFAETVAQPA